MQHTPSEARNALPSEVLAHAETVRARHEAARLIAARRYWQRTKRNAALPLADALRQQSDLSR